ncbi:MAG: hypothetical protein JWR74_403 [Polaromonas sp.]|nr:hypothetical protein [Polaromonas sp.]
MPPKSVDSLVAPDLDRKDLAARLVQWQVPPAGSADTGKKMSKARKIAEYDPGAKPFSSGDKAQDKETVEALALELDALQNLFYADRRFKLLVILQGTDTSGKDGTLRGVFSRMSPLGVHTAAWKAPNEDERARDYLWRIHQKVPANGEIMIFNRSH